ncbi:TerD family protein [Sinomonas humi]|uniref:TerD domain-containing protein n=1 Tax=Sinomonas humi TaxID=1338436 RepID=A0A0B2APQ6_9MICC|nr:TerD family protein [Sinomonas humi]KHL03937.1 hypothetical protein LK10_07735 [Sinomonas humi]
MGTLTAGESVGLTGQDPGLTGVMVAMGWRIDPAPGAQPEPVPLAIVCGDDGRALTPEHLVFFNQLTTASPGVAFASQGTNGAAYGDEAPADAEQVDVDFSQVPPEVARIAFVTYIDPEVRGAGSFAQVGGLHLRVVRPDGSELVRFDASPDSPEEAQAVLCGELYRYEDGWAFRALGRAYENGLAGVGAEFGLDV